MIDLIAAAGDRWSKNRTQLRHRLSGLLMAIVLCAAAPAVDSVADDTGITVLVGRSPPSVRWENGKLTGYWVELLAPRRGAG